MRSFRCLIHIPFLLTVMGCDALWQPYGYPNPESCQPDPTGCSLGMECNLISEVCEPSVPLPTQSRPYWVQQAMLQAADGLAGDRYGESLSLSGDTVLIGAPFGHEDQVMNTGAAYVYVRDPLQGTWTQQARLKSSNIGTGDFAGLSVSLSGDVAVVGAYGADIGGQSARGEALVFRRAAGQGSWSEEALLVASDGTVGDIFGNAVAVEGDTALIGARLADAGGFTDSGAAYVYVRGNDGRWSQQGPRLTAGDGASGDMLGSAVALSGNTALVGAFMAGGKGLPQVGAAYVFVRDPGGGPWTQQAKLVASDGQSYDRFGESVALLGDMALVGAPNAPARQRIGQVYVFTRNPATGTWSQKAQLLPPGTVAGDAFGQAVALSASWAAVSATGVTVQGQPGAGAGYVYARPADGVSFGVPVQLAVLGPMAGDSAGTAVTLSGDTLGIGVSHRTVNGGSDFGAAYLFQFAKQLGDPCTSASECQNHFCVDGVCCDTDCGGGDPTDCQACSAAAGAQLDESPEGICRPRRAGRYCRSSSNSSSSASCDGHSLSCPPDP